MQRRIEQPNRHGQARHRLEDALEVALLERQQLVERGAAAGFAVGEDHLLHDRQTVAEEHVLGAAEPDALGAELPGARCILGVVGVRAHLQPPFDVRPAEDRLEVLVDLRRDQRHLADEHAARAAVDRDHVALDQPAVADRRETVAERQLLAARDARLPHSPRHDRGVRGHAAVDGEDPLRRDHPVDVVGVVSQLTRITGPVLARSTAVSASKTIAPLAAPGDAFNPFAATSSDARGSIIGCRS